jgi:ribonuclease P protein component
LGAAAAIGKATGKAAQAQATERRQLTCPPSSIIGAHDSGCLLGRPFFIEFEHKGMSDEAHLPAEQSRPQAASRLPRPDGNRRRSQGAERAPGSRPKEAQRLVTIKKRADFVAANGGLRATTPGFILLVRDRKDADTAMRVGFTVTKKIGGAVVRNRMKRRFRALAREIISAKGLQGADHVMIGRAKGIERDFALLRFELQTALEKMQRS